MNCIRIVDEWPKQNFFLHIKQTCYENKEKYELGDFKVIQYQILKTILRIVRQTVRRSTIDILEVKGLMYTFVKRKCQEMIMNRCHQPKMWPFRNWVEKWLVQGSTWQTLRKQSWLPCRKINPCLYEWMASSVHISPFRIIFLYINVVYFFFLFTLLG